MMDEAEKMLDKRCEYFDYNFPLSSPHCGLGEMIEEWVEIELTDGCGRDGLPLSDYTGDEVLTAAKEWMKDYKKSRDPEDYDYLSMYLVQQIVIGHFRRKEPEIYKKLLDDERGYDAWKEHWRGL